MATATPVSAQFALYPLGVPDVGARLEPALSAVRAIGVSLEVGQMSSTIEGNDEQVFAALREAFRAVAAMGDVVLVTTLSNACHGAPQ
jgi:uncharacterized protein YqgV (UPF0045/DUF77 family)